MFLHRLVIPSRSLFFQLRYRLVYKIECLWFCISTIPILTPRAPHSISKVQVLDIFQYKGYIFLSKFIRGWSNCTKILIESTVKTYLHDHEKFSHRTLLGVGHSFIAFTFSSSTSTPSDETTNSWKLTFSMQKLHLFIFTCKHCYIYLYLHANICFSKLSTRCVHA